MTRVRSRSARTRRGDFPMTVEAELRDFLSSGRVHAEFYRWRLSRFFLPTEDRGPHRTAAELGRRIELAREHEASMDSRYPGGPDGRLYGVTETSDDR